uniref:HNH endonuclease signature motif containing protein n=1 Tax=unclassified Rhodococcus (in: high G+C Gram-positive bacteria) TaxID=192944 RepID=UPI0015959DEA|nr:MULTISPECIES: HNH endonuclease signature motif containing protein [unclassified Rhodococcus (in: high G+C Gram-positive bacteria)]
MAVPIVSLEALTAAACAENRHAARKVAACYRVHCDWIERDTEHKHYSRYGRTEMAVALGCSATVAESYVSVGVALHTRLPLLRAAFETGEIDLPRVRTVCRILDNLSDEIVTSVEDDIVEAARRNSPGPLEKEIWDILLRVAPEEAAALREFAKRFRHVSYSPAGELARIRAELTAPEAAAAWQLLEEMADTLCPKDPRGKQDRLCDAFMARMHGEPRLTCLCHREDCPKKDAALPNRRVPLTMITVDIATLIGLFANPAYLAGHGSIDPDLARELARNSQWQVLLTEAVTLAEKLGLAVQNPETGEWERRPDSEKAGAATGPETETDAHADADADRDANADTGADVDSAADADAGEGTGSATDWDREADSSTEPNSSSSPAPAPAPGNTSALAAPAAPADEVDETDDADETDETDESTPVPATDPSATPDPGAADPVRKHAATRSGVPVSDPLAEATSNTDPAARTEPESAPRSPARQTSPAPDIGPNCPESRSSTTPSGSTTAGPTAVPEPAAATVSSPTSKPPAEQGSLPDPVPAATGPTDPAPGDDRSQRRLQSLTSAASLFCTHTPVGRGTRHSSALDLPSAIRRNRSIHTSGRTPTGLYLGNASLAAALEAAIAADPTLGKSVARDPLTDRALIYRPDTLTTAAVRLRDRHCRFPDCHRPADRCQLDHIIAFDHTNPLGGGWTTINNLQCLCEFHHTVKTAGYWKAVMLPGGAILWRSTSKTTRITLPANGTAVPVLENDLRPHIPTKPRRSGIIAYPDPPESPESETEPVAEETDEPPF